MMLEFTKMQGLGNDFVVFDAVRQTVALSGSELRALADRRFGVGCDQILVVRPPRDPAHDFSYQIFNADGSEVEHCGNGARCFARFVHEQGLSGRSTLKVETVNRVLVLERLPDGQVTVDMGAPALTAAEVPMQSAQPGPFHTVTVDDAALEITALSMGNPHAVLRFDALDDTTVTRLGPRIEHHPAFPARVNAGFLQVLGRSEVRLRVWERGAGETLACGTGACAAVVAGILRGWLDASVLVHTRGGTLRIDWPGTGQSVRMTGHAATSFNGRVDPAALSRNLP